MAGEAEEQLRAYVEYFRDLGVYDFYRRGDPVYAAETIAAEAVPAVTPPASKSVEPRVIPERPSSPPVAAAVVPPTREIPEFVIPKPVSFDDLAPLPEVRVAAAAKPAALVAIQDEIGDCTRCPLAYAGRRKIVF